MLRGKRTAPMLAALIAVVFIIIIGVSQAHAIKNQLNDWKLLPQPEKLTELYFDNSSNIPTTYTSGVTQNFSFMVHNIEYRSENYKYIVIEQSSDYTSTQTLTIGSFNLAQNQVKSTKVYITPVDLGSKVNISVKLVNFNESIDYWVSKKDIQS